MAKKQYFYSPYTGEIIKESKKMDWYGVTHIVPPEVKENECLIFKDGNWIIEENDNSEQLEKDRIAAINLKVNEIIEAKYPFKYAQVNIPAKGIKNDAGDCYDDRDIEEMYMFINTARLIGKQAKTNGTQPEDIDWMELDRRMSIYLENRNK